MEHPPIRERSCEHLSRCQLAIPLTFSNGMTSLQLDNTTGCVGCCKGPPRVKLFFNRCASHISFYRKAHWLCLSWEVASGLVVAINGNGHVDSNDQILCSWMSKSFETLLEE